MGFSEVCSLWGSFIAKRGLLVLVGYGNECNTGVIVWDPG